MIGFGGSSGRVGAYSDFCLKIAFDPTFRKMLIGFASTCPERWPLTQALACMLGISFVRQVKWGLGGEDDGHQKHGLVTPK